MRPKIKKAFTLMEIMVVIVIAGVIAGFAIPSYVKSMERSHESDAINQLSTIHAANQIYLSRAGRYWPLGEINEYEIDEINAALSLNIIANGMTYSCIGIGGGTAFTCTATRDAPATPFTVTVTEAALDATNPMCTSGTPPCP
ncbi:MAG: type II secretion system protein [Candidatus Omnitrophica bacterium]|nr:type II secretion system protein [Candidatus Omnitrophota bacterium]